MEDQYHQFCDAVRSRDVETLRRLLRDFPALHNFEGEDGSLLDVLQFEAPELLETAFQAGLSPDAGREQPIQTLLQGAAAEGDLGILRLAIRYGVNLEKRNEDDEVALGYACSWGQLEAVKVLVEAGADVNVIEDAPRGGDRLTPLDCARLYPEIEAYLRSQGAKHLRELEPSREPTRQDQDLTPPEADA
jgi:ankyrin repeat protein